MTMQELSNNTEDLDSGGRLAPLFFVCTSTACVVMSVLMLFIHCVLFEFSLFFHLLHSPFLLPFFFPINKT